MDGLNQDYTMRCLERDLRHEIAELKYKLKAANEREERRVKEVIDVHNKNTELKNQIARPLGLGQKESGAMDRVRLLEDTIEVANKTNKRLVSEIAELKAQIASSEPVEPHAINITRKAVKRLAISLLERVDLEFFTVHGNDFTLSGPKPAGKPVTLASSQEALKKLWPETNYHAAVTAPGTFFGIDRSPKSERLNGISINSLHAQELAEARSAVGLAWENDRKAYDESQTRTLNTMLYGPPKPSDVRHFTKNAEGEIKTDKPLTGKITVTSIDRAPPSAGNLNAANVDIYGVAMETGFHKDTNFGGEPSGIAKGNTCPRCNEFNEYAEPGNRLCYGCAR